MTAHFRPFASGGPYRSNETASLVVSDLWDGHQVRDRVQIQAKHMKKKVSRRPIPIVPQLKQALLCWFMQLQQSGLLKPDTPALAIAESM